MDTSPNETENTMQAAAPVPIVPRITEVRYGFTFNLGNFQSERIDAAADVEPDADAGNVLAGLRIWVHEAHRNG
jgi:hypothetical protein